MRLLSTNDLRALEIVISQIKDFPPNQGRYRRGYVSISNDEYHRLAGDVFNIIRAEIEIRNE